MCATFLACTAFWYTCVKKLTQTVWSILNDRYIQHICAILSIKWGFGVVGVAIKRSSEKATSAIGVMKVIPSGVDQLLVCLPCNSASKKFVSLTSQWRHISVMASQRTNKSTVYLTACSGQRQKKHQAPNYWPVWGIRQWPVDSLHKGPVMRIECPRQNVIILIDYYCAFPAIQHSWKSSCPSIDVNQFYIIIEDFLARSSDLGHS